MQPVRELDEEDIRQTLEYAAAVMDDKTLHLAAGL